MFINVIKERKTLELQFENAKKQTVILHNYQLPSFDFVKQCACQATGIDYETFHSKSRKTNVVFARYLFSAYFLANDIEKRYTINSIARSCKLCNHSAAIYGSRTLSNLIEIRDAKATRMVEDFLWLIFSSSDNPVYPIQIRPLDRQKIVKKQRKS